MWTAPEDLDPECRPLCQALNTIDGLQTVESCCGHGQWDYYITFDATWTALERLRRTVDQVDGWVITTRSYWYCLLGPTGEPAYKTSLMLAGLITGEVAALGPERSA